MSRVLIQTLMFAVFLLALTVASLPIIFGQSEISASLVPDAKEPADVERTLKSMDATERKRLTQAQIETYLGNPLSLRSLQNLIILHELDSRTANAEMVALALASFSRRSLTSQLSAAQIDLAAKRYESAFARLDGILRAEPSLVKQFMPSLAILIQNREPRKHFADILATSPPWRSQIFAELSSIDPKGALTYSLLADVRKANGTASDYEKRLLIWKLLADKQHARAYFIWLDLLSKDELLKVHSVFDPGFTQEPKHLGFDWNLATRKTARIETITRPGQSSDRILSLEFYDDRDGGAYVYQYLQLSPGSYVLSFDVQVDSLNNEQGLVWNLRCLAAGTDVAKSAAIRSQGPWENQSVKFQIPEVACDTQILELRSRSSAALDQIFTGRVAFDNVSIQRSGEE
jgi:hypothetical protein